MSGFLPCAPAGLRTLLAHGGEGPMHLSGCARMANEAGLAELAGALAAAAWAQSPLDASLAVAAAPHLAAWPEAACIAAHVVQATRPPAETNYYARLAARREAGKIKAYLRSRQEAEPDNVFWTRLALTHALAEGDLEWAELSAAQLPAPLAACVRLDRALLAADAARALEHLPAVPAGPLRPRRAALAALAAGQGGDALTAWAEAEPWNATALLLASDAALRHGVARAMPDGRAAVLLYTFNKAADIDATLASLAASRLAAARLAVLDNGSQDDTPAVLSAWRDRLGPDRLEVVSLPVNVGAPAARNWLAALPWVRACDFAVYLDDDVSLPQDWLELLGAASRLYPEAGVWGARVTDRDAPARIQSADVFLVPEPGAEAYGSRRFALSSCHHQALDAGQFAYVRPCATVTGCCHMFRTERLAAVGGFDLRYSPTQYDDLDHDVRLLLAGSTPVYQGHLAVRHFKSTGAQGGAGQAQYGLGWANQYKLHQKFEAEQFRQAAACADAAALADLDARRAALEGAR